MRIIFFAVITVACYRLADRTFGALVSVDFPKQTLYFILNAMLAVNLIRSIQMAIYHWRAGGSSLNLTAPPTQDSAYEPSWTDWLAPGSNPDSFRFVLVDSVFRP